MGVFGRLFGGFGEGGSGGELEACGMCGAGISCGEGHVSASRNVERASLSGGEMVLALCEACGEKMDAARPREIIAGAGKGEA